MHFNWKGILARWFLWKEKSMLTEEEEGEEVMEEVAVVGVKEEGGVAGEGVETVEAEKEACNTQQERHMPRELRDTNAGCNPEHKSTASLVHGSEIWYFKAILQSSKGCAFDVLFCSL